jgi:putative ABC transport system permease protein
MLRNYLKIAVKVLLRRKVFAAVSLFGISFTLVVLTVVVALLDHLVSPLAPETRRDRTLAVHQFWLFGPDDRRANPETSFLVMDRYARGIPAVERMSLFSTDRDVPAYVQGNPVIIALKRTDADFWKVLDFTFVEGGPYTDDDVTNARLVTVITESTRRRFFGDGPAVGNIVEADALHFRVIGVVPDVSRLQEIPFAEMWVPHTTEKSDTYRTRIEGGYAAVFLARRRSDLTLIRDEIASRFSRVPIASETGGRFTRATAYPETAAETAARLYLGPEFLYDDEGRAHVGRFFAALGAMALVFMLIPTVNLVNLNVSRILERSSEIGVRKTFGATSRTLVGQFVVENVVLTVIGGLIGFVLAYGVLAALSRSDIVPYATFQMNLRVFAGGLALAVVFGIVSGVYPAWRMSRLHPVQALKRGAL